MKKQVVTFILRLADIILELILVVVVHGFHYSVLIFMYTEQCWQAQVYNSLFSQ